MKSITLTIILTVNVIIGLAQNLVSNSSFEDTTLQGWENQWCGIFTHQDAPTNGGNSCIRVPYGNAQGCFPNYVYQVIPGVSSGDKYELSGWVKSTGLNAPSAISLGKKMTNGYIIQNFTKDTTSSIEWKYLTLIDTFSFDTNEIPLVVLQSGLVTGPLSGNSYFDMISLTISDTLSIRTNSKFAEQNIMVYPNPSYDKITIEIMDNKNENHILTIYNTIGQCIKIFQTSNQLFTLDKKDIENGLYFYKVQTVADKIIIGQGKLVFE